MNFANLDQYKQTGVNGDFYEFKFEWEEREDNLEFFNFEVGFNNKFKLSGTLRTAKITALN